MKKIIPYLARGIIFFVILSLQSFAHASMPATLSLAPMLEKVLPAVVHIKAQVRITDFATLQALQKQQKNQDNNDVMDIPKLAASVGSGVIVNAKMGYILTNAHVVSDAQSITVTLGDGRHFVAKLIGIDKPSDIALLQIKAKNLTQLSISNSNNLKVGDFVATIGNPFGLSQTVTSGIISALDRTTLGIENYENFIQTDAPINPGNSGGALINMQGELIGINTAILAPDRGSIGIGFAIPTNMAISVMKQLITYGNVKRGVLGIGAQDITPELASAFNLGELKGAAVTQVLLNSPAEQAGIQVGDIILSVNGINTKNASEVVNTIGFLRVDSSIDINLLRHKKPLTLHVTLSDPKIRTQGITKVDPFLHGVALKNFSLLSPVHGNILAVAVISVDEDSNAWQSNLRSGDIITSVNQQKIMNIEELKQVIAKANKQVLLNILRGPSALFLVINKED